MGMPVVVSVLLFVIYHVLTVIGEKSAIEGVMSCFWGMWLAPLIYLPFGILLTLQATVDASFLDADTWRRWFGRNKAAGPTVTPTAAQTAAQTAVKADA